MIGIVDPRLLPYYLTKEEAAQLIRRSPRTMQNYCDTGVLVRGTHWVKAHGGPRLFLRDGILAWLDGEIKPARTRRRACRVDMAARSPELAAAMEREAHGL